MVSQYSDERSKTRRILVVDDNVDAAQTLAWLLTEDGHEVHVAEDGPSALDQAQEAQPDVVLLDLGLPGLNGYEVAERLRARYGRQMVLVALTGYDDERERCMAAGFDHYLVKPVGLDTLEELLAALPA